MDKVMLDSLKEELNKKVQKEMNTINACMELVPFSPYMEECTFDALTDVEHKLSHLSDSIKMIEKEIYVIKMALMSHEYFYADDPLEDISFLEMCEAISFQGKDLGGFLEESAGLLITKEVLQDCLKKGLRVEVTPRMIYAFRGEMFWYDPVLEQEWLEQRKRG